jgi:hypothetical protein
MSLPATRFALPYVGAAGNQRPHPAARADPQVRGLFRLRQLGHGPVRAHDVPHLQRRHFPEPPQNTAAPAESRKANDPRSRQCSISSCDTPGPFPTRPCPPTAAALSAALQPSVGSDRASLEADPAPEVLNAVNACFNRWRRPNTVSCRSFLNTLSMIIWIRAPGTPRGVKVEGCRPALRRFVIRPSCDCQSMVRRRVGCISSRGGCR